MDYIFIGVVSLVSFYLAVRIAINHNVSFVFITILYSYHFIFTIMYYLIFPHGADSAVYYNVGRSIATSSISHNTFWPGSQFIISLVSNVYFVAPISRFSFFCLFGQFGLFGLLFLYLSIKPLLNIQDKKWTLLIIFMPGLSFWSSALGKDSLIFFPICYSLYLFSKANLNIFKMGCAAFLIFMVRPHIAFIFMMAFCLALILSRRDISLANRLFVFFPALSVCVLTLPITMRFVGISEVSIESIVAHIDLRAGYNQVGTTGLDITQLSVPMRLFTYLFRPLFFDAPGLLGLGVSIENLLYILMFSSFVRLDFFKFIRSSQSVSVYFSILYSFGALLMLGLTTANLGLAIRQKTMFFPFLIYLFVCLYHWRTEGSRLSVSTARSKAGPRSRLRLHGAANYVVGR